MRSKSKLIGNENQMNLFGWRDEAPRKPAAKPDRSDTQHENGATELIPKVKAHASISQKVLDYGEWRRIAVKHMWDSWFVEIEEAINGMEVVDEDMLRAAYKKGTAPKAFVNELAYDCEWINFGPWTRR
jgi:hypothetical protein